MSAGLSTFLLMDKENFFNNTDALSFPHEFPYEFASSYSTESESDDEDVAGLTRRFSRSASVKEPLYDFKEKRVFSGSPESTLGWLGGVRSPVPSPPPFVNGDEDAWNLIYAAAGHVARMKMKMSISYGSAGVVANNSNFAHPHCTSWRTTDREEFFRQQQLRRNRGVSGGGCGGNGAPPQSAWQLQRHRQSQTHPVVPGGGCDGGATAAKRECAGTGVFLPRRYCNNPPESRTRQACSPANLPARMIPMTGPPQIQARVNGGFVPNYEMLMGRRNAMILAAQQRRSNIHGGIMESPVNNPEVLLPQEWTY